MKILVTGFLGFVGSNLLELALSSPMIEHIYGIDDNSINLCNPYISFDHPKITYINITLLTSITSVLENIDIDVIVHLAAKGNVVESVRDPLGNLNSNVISTINLLEFARLRNVPRFIFASTGGALMGNTTPPVNEKSLPAPISPYGASKMACEGYIRAYSNMYNIKSFILRFGNVYGKYSMHKIGIVNKLFHSFQNNLPFKIFGDGTSTRDYVYASNIADAIYKCIFVTLENPFNIYHLAAGNEISPKYLHHLFSQYYQSSVPIEYVDSRIGEVYRNCADYTLANREIGFHPSDSIENLMHQTIAWLKSVS